MTTQALKKYYPHVKIIEAKDNEDFNNYLKNKRMDSEEMIIVRAKEHSKIKKRAEDHELIVYEFSNWQKFSAWVMDNKPVKNYRELELMRAFFLEFPNIKMN